MSPAPCIYCGHPAEQRDHIVPWVAGGVNETSNVVPACRRCNSAKSAQPVEDFLRNNPEALARVRAHQAVVDMRPITPRSRRRPLVTTLPPDLIDAVDAIAAEEDRSRAKMIEIVLRRFVQEHAARRNAA
jgi:hypothetical protein